MDVLLDASAVMAVILNEPHKGSVIKLDVIISRKDGSKFKLVSIHENKKKGKSPLKDIKGIKANVSMYDILDAIRESRERG